MKLKLFALLVILLFFYGCANPSEEDYSSTVLEGKEKAEGDTALSSVIKEWRLFSIIFMLISIVLVALAYMVSNAFNMPEVRAWADVELGEAFSTVFIIALIIIVLVFAEFTTHLAIFNSPEFQGVCNDEKAYCPTLVAKHYVGEYLGKSEGIYEDLQENALEAGKFATLTFGGGINYWLLGYTSVQWKPMGNEMITVSTVTQELQLLMSLRDALYFQEFIINFLSMTVAPLALMLGIIFRSFFITRKLGGQLMAFGIGFMLVFPVTYAIAMYTLQTTIYGAAGSGGQAGGEFCTASCMKLPPRAYNKSNGEGVTYYDLLQILPPQSETETEDQYKERIDNFITSGEEFETDEGDIIRSCGEFDEICPQMCRTLPYPNSDPGCASPRTEYMCRKFVSEECFVIRYVDFNEPRLSGLEPEDFSACPEKCRPVVGLKKEGCDVGYGFVLTEEVEEDPSLADEQIAEEEYSGLGIYDSLYALCERYIHPVCDWWVDDRYEELNTSELLTKYFGYEQVTVNQTVEWDLGCKNQCRWVIAETGEAGFGCNLCEMVMDEEPLDIWEEAKDASDLEGQTAAAEKTCVMIIPEIVYQKPDDCKACNYMLDKGFGAYPPVHLNCPKLCGTKGGVGMQKDQDSLTSAIDGFEGPAEMKSISALVVPALVLPLLNIVITFMFIQTLSPMLGGGIEISGMMRFFK